MQSNNLVVISSAGSRKTTFIVEEALKNSQERILILTYTIENLEQIRRYFIERNSVIPPHVHIQSWFTFLLQHCVRPYQNAMYAKKRIETILFLQGRSPRYIKKDDIEHYYLAEAKRIYTDKISEFACQSNVRTNGCVISRLESIYNKIFIDEVQDLAGYDLDFLELLFRSSIAASVVGDHRQATYVTNHSPKNAKFNGQNILALFKDWEKKGLCSIQERNECYRCNQTICDFADALYSDMAKTKSMQRNVTGHDGIFIVRKKDIPAYIEKYRPKVLRYRVSKETANLDALNFGASKGLTFDRVLIFTTQPVKDYLLSGDVSVVGDKSKIYVGVTRAKYSVAFVHDSTCFLESAVIFQPD